MRKLLLSVVTLSLLSIAYSQDMYWTAYHFKVKAGHEAEVANAFDRFFESEVGKKLPPASFSANMFASSKNEWTHSIIFGSPDKAHFGKMYSGMLQQSADYGLLSTTMDRAMEPVASYLGKSIVMEPDDHNYNTIYEMSVSDPATYAAAFNEMRDALMAETGGKMGLDLHQFMSGNEPGATHVAVASAETFEDLLNFTDIVFSSEAYATFAKKVKDVRKILRVFTTVTTKRYNMPEGM